jgi:hypothetical protein
MILYFNIFSFLILLYLLIQLLLNGNNKYKEIYIYTQEKKMKIKN